MSLAQFDQFEVTKKYTQVRSLIEVTKKIFTDLIEVTKKYTQVRSQSASTQKSLTGHLSAIKLENDKLTKCNNELHLKVIESCDAMALLRTENAALLSKVKQLEQLSDAAHEKIHDP